MFYGDDRIEPIIDQARTQIAQLIAQNPDVSCIIIPESAFHAADILEKEEACQCLNEKNMGKCIDIIVGSFRKTDNHYYNTAYHLNDGKVVDYFDKRHAMALTERVPRILQGLSFLDDLYAPGEPPIDPSDNPRTPLVLHNDLQFIPYICSELFFNHLPDDQYPDVPILSLTNDVWIELSYIQELMIKAAQLRAIQWQRYIVYVSYAFAELITPSGKRYTL
jgi:apolipoprotein N-acyltransferase